MHVAWGVPYIVYMPQAAAADWEWPCNRPQNAGCLFNQWKNAHRQNKDQWFFKRKNMRGSMMYLEVENKGKLFYMLEYNPKKHSKKKKVMNQNSLLKQTPSNSSWCHILKIIQWRHEKSASLTMLMKYNDTYILALILS